MWLKDRMNKIGLSDADIAKALDRTEPTIRNWIYTLKQVPWKFQDVDEVEKLAIALQWTPLELLKAVGYSLNTDYSPKHLALLDRLEALPADDIANAERFIDATLRLFEDSELTTDDL